MCSRTKTKLFPKLAPSSESQNEMESRAALELVIGCRLVIDPVFLTKVSCQPATSSSFPYAG